LEGGRCVVVWLSSEREIGQRVIFILYKVGNWTWFQTIGGEPLRNVALILGVLLVVSGCATTVLSPSYKLEVEEIAIDNPASFNIQKFCRMVVGELYVNNSLPTVQGYVRVKAAPEAGGPTGVYLMAESDVSSLPLGSLAEIVPTELKQQGETIAFNAYILKPVVAPAP